MSLTDRERQVLALLADGHDYAHIARTAFLSLSGVKSACQRIYRKLGANGATHAVAIAYRRGLLIPDGDYERGLPVDICTGSGRLIA